MKKIEFYAGQSIDDVHRKLQEQGEPCFGMFNDKEIYSTDTLDEAYIKVTGITKSEYDERARKEQEEYRRKEAEHKAKIPQLTEEYRSKARGVIPEEHLEYWDEIVPIRLGDLYQGMELDCWLELIAELNNEAKEKTARFTTCKEVFYKQGHSGMSAGLVFSGLKRFHPLGEELAKHIAR